LGFWVFGLGFGIKNSRVLGFGIKNFALGYNTQPNTQTQNPIFSGVRILVSTRRVVIPGLVARRALIAIAIAIAHGKVADRLAGLQRLLSIVALTRAHLAVRPHHNPAAVETVVAHLVRGHDVLTLASALQLLLLLEVELGIRGG